MTQKGSLIGACAAILCLVCFPAVGSNWVEEGNAICVTSGSQYQQKITSDGAGGAVMAWRDNRNGNYDIYAQRIDAKGTVLWTIDGVVICNATGTQENLQIAPDGAGGAVIVWEDERSGSVIYAQRIDADGNVLWTPNGIAVCDTSFIQYDPQVVSDTSGGAIIVWRDYRSGNYDLFAQRIDANGNPMWTNCGEVVCNEPNAQYNPRIIPDGYGGVIITWRDLRNGNSDIYANRIESSGISYWPDDGEVICDQLENQTNPQLISDGNGGAIITWEDYRNTNIDIYAQWISANSYSQWNINGVVVCNASGSQYDPQITHDGAGGAIITWMDGGDEIYAQWIDMIGAGQWTTNGVLICSAAYFRYDPMIVSDGQGGAIITWCDERKGAYEYHDVYAQLINASGVVQWEPNGLIISDAAGQQDAPFITTDGAGGAIIVWEDRRDGSDIYAQRIERNGYWGYPSPEIQEVRDIPGDQGGSVNLTWNASRLDPWPERQISHYTLWRAISSSQVQQYISSGMDLIEAFSAAPAEASQGIVRMEQLGNVTYYWQLLKSVDAYFLPGYADVLPTLFDSTAVSDEYHYFQVIAHTTDPMVYWISDPDSGYSVDNLAPAPPQMLTGQQRMAPEGLALSWASNVEYDLSNYSIYRGLSDDFVPGAGNLIASLVDTTFFDSDWRWDSGYYYKVSAIDIHGNESVFSLLIPDEVTAIGSPAIPLDYYLDQNVPNPFNPMTRIAFGIKEPGHVSLVIYDVSGKQVKILADGWQKADTYEVTWDGTDVLGNPVVSGVYFYRLKAGKTMMTKKMVMLK